MDSISPTLQWVRGPKTAVSDIRRIRRCNGGKLQWVRGPKTAVSDQRHRLGSALRDASMGPRSEDRG